MATGSKTSWKNRALKHISSLSARVNALGERFYTGCGFHYSLEEEVAYLASAVNNYRTDDAVEILDICRNIALEVRLKNLTGEVVRAELSAEQHEAATPKVVVPTTNLIPPSPTRGEVS